MEKHPLQMILEANDVAFTAYAGPRDARLPGIGVPLDGLEHVGRLVCDIMDEVAASHAPEEEGQRRLTREAVRAMNIDVMASGGVVAWFPVPVR
jgi:hypothetical protein